MALPKRWAEAAQSIMGEAEILLGLSAAVLGFKLLGGDSLLYRWRYPLCVWGLLWRWPTAATSTIHESNVAHRSNA